MFYFLKLEEFDSSSCNVEFS